MANGIGGEGVYRGFEGTGEAQILGGNQPLQYGMLFRKQKAEAEERKWRRDIELRKLRASEYDEPEFIDPGKFQLTQSVSEMEGFRTLGKQVYFDNQHLNRGEFDIMFFPAKERINERLTKRKDVGEIFVENKAIAEKNNLDYLWIKKQQEKYRDTDIDEIPLGFLRGLPNHARAVDLEAEVVDSIEKIKDQVQTTTFGGPVDTGLGIVVYGTDRKVRFQTNEQGQIHDDVVSEILNNDKIDQRIRWDIAESMAEDAEDLNQVNDIFDRIRFSDEPAIRVAVRNAVRDRLNKYQQIEERSRPYRMGQYPSGREKFSPEELDVRDRTIRSIQNIWGPVGEQDKPTQQGLYALGNLVGGKLGGYSIIGAVPLRGKGKVWPKEKVDELNQAIEAGEVQTERRLLEEKEDFQEATKNRIELTLRTTTIDGDIETRKIPIDLGDPGSYALINNILNTVGKKIYFDDLESRVNKASWEDFDEKTDNDYTIKVEE